MCDFKVCARCKRDQPQTEYHKRAASKDGLTAICKFCKRLEDKIMDETPKRMKDQRGKPIHIDPIKQQNIVDLWLGDEPLFISEVCNATGASRWQVSQIRLALIDLGHTVKIKKQDRSTIAPFVISGNTEQDSTKNREAEKKKRCQDIIDAEERRQKMKEVRHAREDKLTDVNYYPTKAELG
jgi:hypothetical protein